MDYDINKTPVMTEKPSKASSTSKKKETQLKPFKTEKSYSNNLPVNVSAHFSNGSYHARAVLSSSGKGDKLSDNIKLETGDEKPPARGYVNLEDASDKELADFIRKEAKENPRLEARLKAYFKNAGQPVIDLPTSAPRLWDDRRSGTNAAQFIREIYAHWLKAGVLTGSHIRALDPKLYNSYYVRINRHPEDTIVFAESKPANYISDPQEAIDRRRASAKGTQARMRAKSDTLTHS